MRASRRATTTTRPRVVIIGGGFAGLACANGLDSDRFAVTLVDRKAHFEFLPNIHELLSEVKSPAQLQLSLDAAMHAAGHRFVRGEVTLLDPAKKTVRVGPGRTLQADNLVIAIGSADADYGVSGVQKNSLGFKSVAQCRAIQQRLDVLKGTGRVVIIGGGLEGIEGLGEILRRYRNTDLQLSLVEARSSLLPEGPAAVTQHIARHCKAWDVDCITGDPVTRIMPKTVQLKSGRRLRSHATIWTGGPAPPRLLAEAALAEPHRWAPVDEKLEHPGFPGVFIAGDAAELETPISKQAYHALDMGRSIADTLSRTLDGKRRRRYRPAAKPTLLAFGDLDTVVVTPRGSLAGPPLAAAKEAVFAAVMAQLDQRPVRDRLDAALVRGRQATRKLLWPGLSNWRSLRRQARVKKLT